jgi:hypothetical protein
VGWGVLLVLPVLPVLSPTAVALLLLSFSLAALPPPPQADKDNTASKASSMGV